MKSQLVSIAVQIGLAIVALATATAAQSPIATVQLGRDQIAVVRTAQGITTRISFQESVREIVCGDLYDAATGKGSFVVQRGDNDVFLKPIASKGLSNLFVKTGARGEHVYSFDLVVVPIGQSHRVLNVIDPSLEQAGGAAPVAGSEQLADAPRDTTANHDQARTQGEELIRGARQQAGRIVAEAEQRAADIERQATQRANQEVERRLVRAVMLGLVEIKIANPRVVAKRVAFTTDSKILVFDDKAYLRYTVHNTGDSDFEYTSIALTAGANSEAQQSEIIQSKRENVLTPGESLAGVLVFDPKLVEKGKLALVVRSDDAGEIARVGISPAGK
ncbi:MAG TPA: hypothetical protein VFV34_23805 [Blastocatellia bacterium]|nr:hypothetical protein [Blastocatellia bacterium]